MADAPLTTARLRARYVALALGTIALGLLVFRGPLPLPRAPRDVTGDALWAAMLFWWVGAIAPRARLGVRSGIAYAGCVAMELSQLVRLPALAAIRATTLGHLVLGSDFDARDLVAYAVGVALAASIEAGITRGQRA